MLKRPYASLTPLRNFFNDSARVINMIGLKLFPVYVATLLQLYYGTSGTPTKEYCSISKTAVQILNTFTFKPARVLKTVRKLVLITLKSNIIIKAKHLTKAYFCC